MEQLELASGVSRATIYRRVGNKDALLKRLAAERGEHYEPEDTRLLMLQAAREVFGREGLASATMEQIASQAGVGVATLYRHFGDKDSLVKAFIKEMTPKQTLHALVSHPSDDVQADLEVMVGTLLTFFYDNRQIFRLILMGNARDRAYLASLSNRSESTQQHLSNFFDAQLNAKRLNTHAKSDELALALMGMVISFAVLAPLRYDRKLTDVTATSRMIVQVFLSDLRGDAV